MDLLQLWQVALSAESVTALDMRKYMTTSLVRHRAATDQYLCLHQAMARRRWARTAAMHAIRLWPRLAVAASRTLLQPARTPQHLAQSSDPASRGGAAELSWSAGTGRGQACRRAVVACCGSAGSAVLCGGCPGRHGLQRSRQAAAPGRLSSAAYPGRAVHVPLSAGMHASV